MGEEALCVAYYEQPERVHAILDAIGEMAFRALERVSRVVPPTSSTLTRTWQARADPSRDRTRRISSSLLTIVGYETCFTSGEYNSSTRTPTTT